MKVVILAGGFGTRLAEETAVRPKPMIEIGGRPILWHIMKIYSAYGLNDFVICLGYRGYYIKEFFSNYFLHTADVTFDVRANTMQILRDTAEPWRVTLIDTGENTQTGGRIRRIADHIRDDEAFAMTYGDGVGDMDIAAALGFHRAHGRMATVTAVRPPRRFGAIAFEGTKVVNFIEKPHEDGGWVSGGFFILSPKVLDLLDGDGAVWELGPMEWLARNDELRAFRHQGFWHPMDTLRDKTFLEEKWSGGAPPWRVW